LYEGAEAGAATRATLDEETAWRLFTKGIDSASAHERVAIEGDVGLGEVVLRTVAIIA
jgi:hypothetical protein